MRAPLLLLLIGALGAFACGNKTTPTEPTTPPVTVNDSFSGTLAVNGATTYPFTVSAAGAVTATLSALTPELETPIAVSIALGTWNGTTCTLVVTNDQAVKTSLVSGTATGATTLCLRVADVGNVATVTDPVTYTVDVVHY